MWVKATGEHRLDADHVDIWRSRIDLPAQRIDEFHATLSDEEKQRAARFKFPGKFEEYVVTRGLLRQALSIVASQPASSFDFRYSEDNKPFLDLVIDDKPIAFNVSHSHGMALVALGLDRRLGIDVEKLREDPEHDKLARRYFSKVENEQFEKFQGDRVRAFFATWTRKEAFVKAVGKGIKYGLSEFDVNIDPDEAPRMLRTGWQENDLNNWHMLGIDCGDDYIATVIADGPSYSVRLWE